MTKQEWLTLLRRLQVQTQRGATWSKVTPVTGKALDAYEKARGLKLPDSYRTYCTVFGGGTIGSHFTITVPGSKKAEMWSLQVFDEYFHDEENETRSRNPEQHRRAIYFASDIATSCYFFDPGEITDQAHNEYAVYKIFRDYELQRIADNFWLFVTEFCLGKKQKKLLRGVPVVQEFRPRAVRA
jgi:SMI1 / KNR4 family (SUKH-1)